REMEPTRGPTPVAAWVTQWKLRMIERSRSNLKQSTPGPRHFEKSSLCRYVMAIRLPLVFGETTEFAPGPVSDFGTGCSISRRSAKLQNRQARRPVLPF